MLYQKPAISGHGYVSVQLYVQKQAITCSYLAYATKADHARMSFNTLLQVPVHVLNVGEVCMIMLYIFIS